jgi:penicillin-binding protein 1A
MVDSIVAIEDERFWEHNGIDVHGIARAFVQGIKARDFSQGASTLTLQLIKNNVFNVGLDETTFLDKLERKIQEQYLAVAMEKQLDKKTIVEYYLNTIYLGEGCYGVDTAATTYFDKDLNSLTLSECAVLAAIPQNPSKYDPVTNPDENSERRDMVLDKMLELEYITQAEYDEAKSDKVYDRIAAVAEKDRDQSADVNSYYTDEVIKQLQSDLEAKGYSEEEAETLIWSGGLKVMVCQDPDIQSICDEVTNDASYFPTPVYQLNYALTLVDEDTKIQTNYSLEDFKSWYSNVNGLSTFKARFSSEEDARAATDAFKEAKMAETGSIELLETFNLVIQPQISFTVMDQSNGQVMALVGGRGEKTENRSFNRATEATRQPGSCFKILAAFLPALDACDMSLATVYDDAPYYYENGNQVFNWYKSYWGPKTIRYAIMESMNIIAVKCITDVTPQLAYEYLLKLGFTTLVERKTDSNGLILSDINQSLALGGLTNGITNLEITAAYATIANGGSYIKPVFYTEVYDHDGNLIIDNREPEKTRVISEQTAWLLTNAMRDVVTGGTGTAANSSLGLYTVGKTGTTSDDYDAWFCGYNPYYTAAIWLGFDENTTYSPGSIKCMIWRNIMDQIIELKGLDTTATFEMPSGISQATVCSDTGLLPSAGCPTVTDYFDTSKIPTKRCPGVTKVTVCNESHMLANDECPETTTYMYTEDDDGNYVLDGYTWDKSLLNEHCNLHGNSDDEDDSESDDSTDDSTTESTTETTTTSTTQTTTETTTTSEPTTSTQIITQEPTTSTQIVTQAPTETVTETTTESTDVSTDLTAPVQ